MKPPFYHHRHNSHLYSENSWTLTQFLKIRIIYRGERDILRTSIEKLFVSSIPSSGFSAVVLGFGDLTCCVWLGLALFCSIHGS